MGPLWGNITWSEISLLLRRFVFRIAEASAKRVTGDEPQGTMGRVQTAGEAPLPVVSFPASFARETSGHKSGVKWENKNKARKVYRSFLLI